jgi:hypothetical protein
MVMCMHCEGPRYEISSSLVPFALFWFEFENWFCINKLNWFEDQKLHPQSCSQSRFIRHLMQMPVYSLKLRYDCSPPFTIQPFVHWSAFLWTQCNLSYWQRHKETVQYTQDRWVCRICPSSGILSNYKTQKQTNSVVWVRRQTIPTERDHRLSAKLVPTFVDTGCHVVSMTDPYGRILGFQHEEDNVSETGPVFFFRWGKGNTYSVGSHRKSLCQFPLLAWRRK